MRHYTSIRLKDSEEGWFFFDDDKVLTYEDGLEIANDPLMTPLSTSPAIHLENGGVVLSTVPLFLLPDKQRRDSGFAIVQDNKIIQVDLYKRFNACNLMIKHIGGCHVCPEQGFVCFNRMLSKPLISAPVILNLPKHWTVRTNTHTAMYNALRTVGTVGKYKFLSPAYTKTGHFEPIFRNIHEHDFSLENREFWRKLRSTASKTSAAVRKFRKKYCVVCPVNKVCSMQRWCGGPYPEEGASINIILDTWLARLEDSGIPEEKFWQIARSPVYGTKPRRNRRCSQFSGWTWKNNKFQLTGFYTSRGEKFDMPEEELVKYIDYTSFSGERPSNLMTALYFMSLEQKTIASHKGHGWSYQNPWYIRSLTVNDNHIRIQCADNKRPIYTEFTLASFDDFFTIVTPRLPGLTQLTVNR